MARLLFASCLLAALLAPRPCCAQSASDDGFLDPTEDEEPHAERRAISEPTPPPLSHLDPPRQVDSWELGASVFAFGIVSADGVGLIARSHVVYRFDLPLMVRADLMPLGLSFADDGFGGGAFGLLSVGLDLHAFGLTLGVGAVSNNEHEQNVAPTTRPGDPVPMTVLSPGAMTAVIVGVRIGVADGLALFLRSGVAVDHERGRAQFALFEGWAQVPFDSVWALTLRGSWTMSGNGEIRLGMRAWLEGRGAAGSVALLLDGGLGRVVYHPPSRSRGYPAPIDHLGPGFGVGVEGRL